jgi:hypothetical protein
VAIDVCRACKKNERIRQNALVSSSLEVGGNQALEGLDVSPREMVATIRQDVSKLRPAVRHRRWNECSAQGRRARMRKTIVVAIIGSGG